MMFFTKETDRNNKRESKVWNVKSGAKNTNIASKEKWLYGNDMQ